MNPFTYPDGYTIDIRSLLGLEGNGSPQMQPQGILCCTIKSASGVPKTDFFGLCDPYVKVFVNDREYCNVVGKKDFFIPSGAIGNTIQFEIATSNEIRSLKYEYGRTHG